MKKRFERFVLIVMIIAFALMLTEGCGTNKVTESFSATDSPFSSVVASSMNESQSGNALALNMETEHFQLYCSEKDKPLLEGLSKALESGFNQISNDLYCTLEVKTIVKIYPDTETFHNAIGKPDAPSWYVGEGSGGVISITSDMTHVAAPNVVVHELTHIFTNSNFGVLPEWLFQGIAMYEGKETPVSSIESAVRACVSNQNIPSLKELDIDYWSFAEKGYYEYSYAAVEFIIHDFGYEGLNEFLRSPYNYKESFGLNEDEINSQWVEYLKGKYK